MSNYDDFLHFRKLFEKSKKLKIFPTPALGTLFAHFTLVDFIQMSEFLYFSCPDVKLWWFSSFSETFRKIEKIEDFPHPGPGDPFRSFHTCAQISSKWVNFYILVVLMSNYDDFLHFETFRKIEKIEDFPHPGPGDPFAHFTLCTDFIQMSEFLYFSCSDVKLWWELFEKSKKLKIFPTPALGTLFAHFTLVHRFHPNEWIFIF